ncbi:FadR family transcriptional regulator [Haloechinothrix sp. YIM 98757]|uniref:FadR family transcriptional regulator n=1 Tax=Haloechinothrix aidingensis TaxID=2752311 RepID=A0A838ABC4_9PSEU|nr:FadR/GntR family transcriptional regulator [Haloechinothrix aidingensis]MBA0126544.1 FadR family transcriptional regulator [Haloechinothrix aidingensis]
MSGWPTNSTRVQPKKAADLVANHIRLMIARGEVGDGEWLPTEARLMEQFGVSRPTLREAFRLLEADSLITIRRGPPGGAKVTIPGPEAAASQFAMLLTLSKTTIQDVYDARMVIEPAAAHELARRGSAAGRRALADELENTRLLADKPAEFGAATVRFHQRLVELSGNKTLATVVGMLAEIVSRHVTKLTEEAPAPDEERISRNHGAVRAYERLVELVQARDGQAAEQYWRKHMRSVRPHMLGSATGEIQVVDLLY